MQPLQGVRVVTLAVNLPWAMGGAAARIRRRRHPSGGVWAAFGRRFGGVFDQTADELESMAAQAESC
jgi:hypothetical protein